MTETVTTTIIATSASALVGFLTWYATMKQVKSVEQKTIADVVDDRIKILLDGYEKRIDYLTKELIKTNEELSRYKIKVEELERRNLDAVRLEGEKATLLEKIRNLEAKILVLEQELRMYEEQRCMRTSCPTRMEHLPD